MPLPAGATALEVGCGTGAVTRELGELSAVREVVGVDPSPVFLARARELGRGRPQLVFQQGDARALPFPEATFDLVLFHTTLCHVLEPELALREAHRVLRAGGCLAVFDGDYTTATVAVDAFDPLQRAVEAMTAHYVQRPWLIRRLGKLLGASGFDVTRASGHAYTQLTDPTYLFTIVERGAEVLAQRGSIGAEQAEALKSEARRRAGAGEFFGHIAYVSVLARKRG